MNKLEISSIVVEKSFSSSCDWLRRSRVEVTGTQNFIMRLEIEVVRTLGNFRLLPLGLLGSSSCIMTHAGWASNSFALTLHLFLPPIHKGDCSFEMHGLDVSYAVIVEIEDAVAVDAWAW